MWLVEIKDSNDCPVFQNDSTGEKRKMQILKLPISKAYLVSANFLLLKFFL